MKYAIDKIVIDNFRDKVNGNSGFVFEIYKNINGKDHWSIICSCMDWINVAVSYLHKCEFDTRDVDIMSMQVYTYISSIDIIYESVKQLHRVIISNKSTPFERTKYIFSKNDICNSDNEYFKELRAAFGAHPVNLKNKHGKWYASWPTNLSLGNDYDFQLLLYSDDVKKEYIKFGLKFTELNDFLKERYLYLNHIVDILDSQYANFKEDLKKEIIQNSDDIQAQLQILKFESIKRLNNDYYRSTIDELIIIYEHNIISENLKIEEHDYKIELLQLVTEVKDNLQNMNLSDLEYDSILNPDHHSSITYPISKLFNCDFDPSNDPLFDYYMKEMNDYSSGKYDFRSDQSKNELFLKLKLMLYYEKNVN